MGRELKRVPLDFDWPLNKVWKGFVNPLYCATKCEACDGRGYSPEAKAMHDRWYGYAPFKPEDRGSVPFTPQSPEVRAFAERQCTISPDYYGAGERAIMREAERLCRHWNAQWSHHLNQDDVDALIEAGRLMDFTHKWSRETGWQRREPPITPTAQQVNAWSLSGMGHDSINNWVVIKAECARLGVSETCGECEGEGSHWPSPEAKAAYDAWEREEPPTGDGYQIWETVSEGSPISPPFSTEEDLARHMATTKWGADEGTSYSTWLNFIRGPGWAPSMIGSPAQGLVGGVEGIVALTTDPT